MIISIAVQFKLVFFSFTAGIILGILFDMYRVVRGFERIAKVFVIIEDILFWIFTSLVIFIYLLCTNKAYIGFYVYLLIILGLLFYIKLASKTLVSMHIKTIKFISKLLRICKNVIFYPIQLLIYVFKTKKYSKDNNK